MLVRSIGTGLLGGIFIAVGLALFWFLGVQTRLDCDRPEPRTGHCTLTSTNPLGLNAEAHPVLVSELQRAEVQVSVDDDDGSETYRVVLVTERGPVPFTNYYSSGLTDKQQKADQINAFLKDKDQRTLTLSQDDRFLAALFGVVFTGIGGAVAAGGLRTPLGALRRRWFGR